MGKYAQQFLLPTCIRAFVTCMHIHQGTENSLISLSLYTDVVRAFIHKKIVTAVGEYHNHVQRFEHVGVKELSARGRL